MEYELYHYGVKGMKWGVRRARLKSAKQLYRDRKNKAFGEYERDIQDIERSYKRGQNLSKADQKREADVEKKYNSAVSDAKRAYVNEKRRINGKAPLKDYKPNKVDELIYGKRGAERIAKRRSKGQSYKVAKGKEFVRQAVNGTLFGLVMTDIALTGGQGTAAVGKAAVKGAAAAAKAAVKTGKKVVEDFISRNGAILDANGNLIRGVNVNVRDVTDAVMDLAVRR